MQEYLVRTRTSIVDVMRNPSAHRNQILVSLNSFKKIRKTNEDTKLLRVRAVSSNVCDSCFLFQHVVRLSADASCLETEVAQQQAHMERANLMKLEYKTDCMEAKTGKRVVLSFDYAQNLALPNSSQVPSKYYILSLYNLY